jgi:hypothetical protein
MADSNYDQASRYLSKEADAPMTLWLLGLTAEQIRFETIKDSVTVFPGKDRICDMIAGLADLTRGGAPCAAIIEFQITPDPEMFGRMLIAGGMIWIQVKPSAHPGDRYDLIAVVVNLTGKGDCARQVIVGTAEWKVTPRELNLETLDAAKVLDEIEAGAAPNEVLAWIPLMHGGGEDVIIERWLGIASAEPSLKKRGDYALATVFAQAVGTKDLWVRRLEGLTMIDTPLVAEWKAKAAQKATLEAKRTPLLGILRAKYPPLPVEIEQRIQNSVDPAELDRWLLATATATTIEKYRQDAGL